MCPIDLFSQPAVPLVDPPVLPGRKGPEIVIVPVQHASELGLYLGKILHGLRDAEDIKPIGVSRSDQLLAVKAHGQITRPCLGVAFDRYVRVYRYGQVPFHGKLGKGPRESLACVVKLGIKCILGRVTDLVGGQSSEALGTSI